MDLPQNKQVQDAIEEVILVSMSTQVKANVPEEFKSFVEPDELAKTLKSMDEAKSEEEALQKIDEYLAAVPTNLTTSGLLVIFSSFISKSGIKNSVTAAKRCTRNFILF